MNNIRPLLHPVPEARRQIGVGNSKFYELVGDGEIRIVKIGRKSLVPDEDLIALRDRLLEKTAPVKP